MALHCSCDWCCACLLAAGLNVECDTIIEIACIVTDGDIKEVHEVSGCKLKNFEYAADVRTRCLRYFFWQHK
eukprot:104362-Pelagomonas_calceolata.AAC.14